jgi:hypothetical protein
LGYCTGRRESINALREPGANAVLAVPFLAASQPAQKVFRVGHVAAGGRTADGLPPRPLRETLRGLGYIEGQNIVYETRFAEGCTKPMSTSAMAG